MAGTFVIFTIITYEYWLHLTGLKEHDPMRFEPFISITHLILSIMTFVGVTTIQLAVVNPLIRHWKTTGKYNRRKLLFLGMGLSVVFGTAYPIILYHDSTANMLNKLITILLYINGFGALYATTFTVYHWLSKNSVEE